MRLQDSYLPSMRQRSMDNIYYGDYTERKLNHVWCRRNSSVISCNGIL
ncbi:MAG: hypothetical protein ACLRZ9_11765 [Eubacterium sp.]